MKKTNKMNLNIKNLVTSANTFETPKFEVKNKETVKCKCGELMKRNGRLNGRRTYQCPKCDSYDIDSKKITKIKIARCTTCDKKLKEIGYDNGIRYYECKQCEKKYKVVEKETKPIVKCICGRKMKRNGKSKNNKQRYYCKECHTTRPLTEPSANTTKYDRKEKSILSALYAMLDNNFWNEDGCDENLKSAFKNTNKYYNYVNNIIFDSTTVTNNIRGDRVSINCYQPKLLVCVNDNKIKFIQIPPHQNCKPDGTPMGRVFSINDNEKYKIN